MKTALSHVLFSLALIGAVGCGTNPRKVQDKASLPSSWYHGQGVHLASATLDLARWWKHFGDPMLTELIEEGLRNNPDVVAASARIRESRARRKAIAASLFPSLSGSFGASSSSTRVDDFGSDNTTSYSAGLDASWEVDLFGGIRSNIAAASAEVGASEENLHSVQATLASEIAIAYTSLRTAEARLEVVNNSVESRAETAQLADWRREVGETDALESNQAISSLEQARASIPSLEETLAQTRNLLAVLTGSLPGTLNELLIASGQSIPSPPERLAIGIPADTLRQRPDVRVAGYQWYAAVANTAAANAERFPSLNLSGSLGLNTLRSGKLLNPETATANLIAGFAGPIFDAGRIRATIEAQGAAEEQALENYRSIVLTALSDVEDALIACVRSAERLTILRRATESAREAATLAEQRYEAGVIDLLTVLDAQRTLLSLEESLLSVRADRTTAYIQLYKALGGGWS